MRRALETYQPTDQFSTIRKKSIYEIGDRIQQTPIGLIKQAPKKVTKQQHLFLASLSPSTVIETKLLALVTALPVGFVCGAQN